MHSRGKSYSTTTNKTILWRYARFGPEGDLVKVAFTNPSAPLQAFGISSDISSGDPVINVSLPSGTEKTGLNVTGSNQFVTSANTVYTTLGGYAVTRTTNVVTVVLDYALANIHTLNVGDMVYQQTDETNFKHGPKAITAITATSFSYAETGSDDTATDAISYLTSKKPAGTSNTVTALVSSGSHITATIGSHIFTVGQTVYFQPGHFDGTSSVGVNAGAKILTSIASTTVTWAESSTTAAATLIPGVAYSISAGECVKESLVYSRAEVTIGSLSRDVSNVVTATMATTPLITAHGFNIGDIVYLTPGEVNFPAGAKIITGTTTTTFNYVESGANTVSSGTEYFSSSVTSPNFISGGTPVVVGDIVHIDSATSLDSAVQGNHRVNTIASTIASFLVDDTNYAGNSIPQKLNATANLKFYPINAAAATAALCVNFITNSATAQNLVTAALVPANSQVSNDGSAQITMATAEEYRLTTSNSSLRGTGNQSLASWPLFDGRNWILATNLASSISSQLSLKSAVSGELTSNSDFSNESMCLIPITATNLVNYLSNSGVSGFYSNAAINRSSAGRKVQLASSTIGSGGAIQITGGTGNLATASVFGSGESLTTGFGKIVVPAAQIKGFTGEKYVSIQGTSSAPKITTWSSANTMEITTTGAAAGEFLISFDAGVTAVNVIQALSSAKTYQIEKHGNFMAYIDVSAAPHALSSNINEGDWVYISVDSFNSTNVGFKQVIRIDTANKTFWVEDTGEVEEIQTLNGTTDFIKFITYDSIIPGDTFTINTPIFGVDNIGTYTVSRLHESGASTTATDFYVFSDTISVIGATTLGSDYIFVQAKEQTPIKLIKRIRSINVNATNSSFYDMVFHTSQYISKVSSAVGSIVTALDKLGFTTNIVTGLDGYSYNTGLLSEVNKVLYGDETNTAVYPGVAAAGATINTSGPLIKRIQMSLEVRFRTGVTIQDVSNRIKSAIASVINSTPVSTPIALSVIVAAANAIDGVQAVTILSPIYNSGNDMIAVQPNEKPRVLNIESDILISIAGI